MKLSWQNQSCSYRLFQIVNNIFKTRTTFLDPRFFCLQIHDIIKVFLSFQVFWSCFFVLCYKLLYMKWFGRWFHQNAYISWFNPKKAEEVNLEKGKMVNPCFSVTFHVILSHIFPKTFIEICQVFQKIWRFLWRFFDVNYFLKFFGFLTFSCYKKTNDVRI